MEQILDLISNYVAEAFETAGYDPELGKVKVRLSDPDFST